MASLPRAPNARADPQATADTVAFALRARPSEDPAPTSFYTIAPGTVLAGKYCIVRTIGRGGMGVVMEARHLQLDVSVAMKLLSPEFVGSQEILGRFLREARAASKLQNHHVTRVIDVGTLDSGEPYMVMEYLAGEDLSQYAKSTKLELVEAVDYVAQACEAIAEAHAVGIIHRDIKPANLFLTKRSGRAAHVKVLDFGVSKIIDEGSEDVRLTQTTTILGSALYMSPEQMRSSKHVDERTDVYALGACLYEFIGGEPPYFAPSFPELCAKVFTSSPRPLRELRPEVPDALAKVVEKTLSRDADQRYQSVPELIRALSPFADEMGRAAMQALLGEHAPELDLLPQVPMPRRVKTGPTRAAPRADEQPKRRAGLWLLLLALLGGASAVAYWKVVLPRQRAAPARELEARPTSATAAPAAVTPPPVTPAGSAPSVASSAPAASGEPPAGLSDAGVADKAGGVSADAGLSSVDGGKAVVGVTPDAGAPAKGQLGTKQGMRPSAPHEPDPAAPAQGAAAIPPRVNADLSVELCTQTMADGSKKVVPCP